MHTVRVVFGLQGDEGLLNLLYEVVRGIGNKNYDIEVETDLLYDLSSPTLEIDGRKIVLEYYDENEAKEQLRRLLRGENVMQGTPKLRMHSKDGILSDGVRAS